MPLRDVVITASINERIGDETYELWLKRGTGPWMLEDTGDVAASPAVSQDFEILGLEQDLAHVAQVRMKRAGRYRIGYLTSDPDAWPAQSRYEFIPGQSASIGEPVLDAVSWARTSNVLHTTSIDITPDDLAMDIQILRNGVVIDTVPGPHAGPITYDDDNPPSEVNHEYTARHVVGFITGAESNALFQWPGPPAPTDLADALGPPFYAYTVSWVNSESGAHTQVQDDYSNGGVYVDRVLANPAATSIASGELPNTSELASNGNLTGKVGTRIRHEWTQFGVTDVSQWHELPDTDPDCVEIQYSVDETEYDDDRPF